MTNLRDEVSSPIQDDSIEALAKLIAGPCGVEMIETLLDAEVQPID